MVNVIGVLILSYWLSVDTLFEIWFNGFGIGGGKGNFVCDGNIELKEIEDKVFEF